ncbi:uncharacterized protein LOC112557103 [Pomacea canaliculata]|uniref:uncharacterized protein LOC112557103 n=1 Tax=Pomacea canaliculata TaxID=400727 RepID=UPI000D73171B|nr:uncharacterized protein LOC112557103 [Pomacea canaliculata]
MLGPRAWCELSLMLSLVFVLVTGRELFRCCTPKAWRTTARTMEASIIQGTNKFHEVWKVINYDEENERFSTSLTTIDGHPESLRVVLDFRKNASYVIVNETRCTRHEVTEPFRPVCTPHNASMVAFGVAPILSPLEGVFANTVYYNTSDVTGQVTITVGNCALIAETTYYHREGVNIVQNTQYLNQTLWVDEKAFAVPAGCNTEVVMSQLAGMASLGLLKQSV